MASDDYPYAEDEFDVLGQDRTPQAVHRAPRPWWRVWAPLIAVVVIAPLVAWGLVELATRDGGAPVASPTSSATSEAPPEETATEDPVTQEPTQEETTPEPTAPPVDQGVAVRVLNGASVQGLAGRVSETLEAAGWTNLEPGNYQSAQPEVSFVYYPSADLAPAAQAVADELGIGNVAELGDITAITVVLRPDFEE